jgi:hypothetical protein
MNFLPNAGAYLGNIDVRVVKGCMAVVEPPYYRCHFTTCGVEGEVVILMGMKDL